jgi:hypothetical protein
MPRILDNQLAACEIAAAAGEVSWHCQIRYDGQRRTHNIVRDQPSPLPRPEQPSLSTDVQSCGGWWE